MKRLLLATAIGLAAASPVMAATINTIADNIPIGETVNLTNINPTNSVTAGQNVFTLAASSGGGTIYAWCIDLFHTISLGNHTYSFTPGTLSTSTMDGAGHTLTSGEVTKMAGLMEIGNGILQGPAANLTDADAYYAGISGATKNDWSAAIQLAIWSTEYSAHFATLTFTGGTTLAHTIFADLVADTTITGTASDLVAIGSQQSFGYSTGSITLLARVPEPASLALLGFGLLGTVAFARRRRA